MEKMTPFFADGRTILFVDDEEKVLTSLKRTLHDEPYYTLFACSGKEALEILQCHDVHVIITDMRMPEMDGLELLKNVKKKYPHIIRMVLSGYTDMDTLLRAINQGEIYRFIAKPWKSNEELKMTIRLAIEFYNLHGELEVLMQFFELWTKDMDPESVDIPFLQELVVTRKKHLYEWATNSDLVQS